MWAYLKTKNSSEPEELVVIGVNSVFLTTENAKDFQICEDVCKAYKWLDSLEKLRKIAAFGYIYCCEVTNDLKRKLDGFPMKPAKGTMDQKETNDIKKLGKDSEDDEESDEDYGKTSTVPDYEDDYD